MDLNHDSATDRYTETLSQALTYFREIAQSNSGWKRLSTSSVRTSAISASTPLNLNLNLSGLKGSSSTNHHQPSSPIVSPSIGFAGIGADRRRKDSTDITSTTGSPSLGRSSSVASSPVSSRHGHDPIASLPGGAPPSSAALAAIDSLLPSISVSKKNVPGKSAEIVRASIDLPGIDALTDLEDWKAVLECTGARKIWDRMVESSTVMQTLDDNTCITRTIFKTAWLASPRDALLIETTLLDHNAVLHIATSIKPSDDDPIFLRPSPPHIRAYLPLVAWHIQLVPAAEVDNESQSFTSFNSLTNSQHRQVMPRHSIRVSFYYQIDMRGWAANSAISIQSHVPSCIANLYKLLRRQGVPPHVSRHSSRIQLDLNEYDPTTGVYELRYDVIPAGQEDDGMLENNKTVSSKLKNFRLGTDGLEESPDFALEGDEEEEPSESVPQEIILSDDEDGGYNKAESGYVDVELDGERWGLGSDIVVHIFMNDIEDEEFVQEHVECLKYMDRNRYILRMQHHTSSGSQQQHGAINVKLRIERIPQHAGGNGSAAKLMTPEQLKRRLQLREDDESEEHSEATHSDAGSVAAVSSTAGGSGGGALSVSVNGREKDIVEMRQRVSFQSHRMLSMSALEQLELSRHIVQEVLSEGGGDGPIERTTSPSPLLLMSTSMPTTIQSLAKSSQSIMSNGTNNMAPGNANPGKVNSSYLYFNSLLHEPATSWKQISQQRGITISKLETQGHVSGIVKGEGEFDLYSIWDIKAALDCISARKVWDKLFDDAQLLTQVTPSSILSYVRFKGFWPTSPKDMAVLNTTFISKDAIHYFATSTDDTNLFPMIPPPMSPFIRSEIAVSGWYIEAVPPRSVKIIFIVQAVQSGWAVPGTALSAMTTELPLCVAEVVKYLEHYGSPPTLVSIRRGRAIGMDYDHEKCSFRLEYVQDSSPVFSGQRQQQQLQQPFQQKFQVTSENHLLRRNTIDLSSGSDANLTGGGDGHSPKMGSATSEKLLAEIRLDARYWAKNGDCDITIDPPPSKVTCSCVPHDGTGYRIRVEHSSGRAVPAGGKVLLMAKKPTKAGNGIVVNGVPIKMPEISHLDEWLPKPETLKEKGSKDLALTLSMIDGALSQKGDDEDSEDDEEDEEEGDAQEDDDEEEEGERVESPKTTTSVEKSTTTDKASASTFSSKKTTSGQEQSQTSRPKLEGEATPLEHAQRALDLLQSLRSDPDETWTIVSYKNGLTTAKRFVPDRISEQVPVVRGEKVIEGFSLDEVATVIGTLGTRAKLDDLYDSGEMLESFGSGCSTFHHILKSFFPLPLPARDLYFVTATVALEADTRCPQVLIVSTSIPHDPENNSDQSNNTTTASRPRAHLHLSAWILESIDPYSSSHPIPSTKVTYMIALDLGGAVPQRISGMFQTGFPKAIAQLESYLQLHAAPPIVRIPTQMIIQTSGLHQQQMIGAPVLPLQDIARILRQQRQQQSKDSGVDGSLDDTTTSSNGSKIGDDHVHHRCSVPRLIPWTPPSSRISSWDFNMDTARFHLVMLFDHFILLPSRLDLALEKRSKVAKQKDRKANGVGSTTTSPSSVSSTMPAATVTSLLSSSNAKNRTVLELVVDLKEYPHGYDIQTEVKVDPEFLLQHKQQREAEMTQQQQILADTISSTATTGQAVNGNSASVQSGRASGGVPLRKSLDLEKLSNRAGIAALLGNSEVPRGLPSSTSLLKILPPPLTVQVVDVPPAPSHSSSLSGYSKRQKHLILVTVPEAEPSPPASTLQHHHYHPGGPSSVGGSSAGGVVSNPSASGLMRGARGSISAGNILSSASAPSGIIQSTGKPKASALQPITTATASTMMPGGGAGIFNTPVSDYEATTTFASSHPTDSSIGAIQFTRSRVQTGPSTFSATTTLIDSDSAHGTLNSLASTMGASPLAITNNNPVPSASATASPLSPEKRVFQFTIRLVRLDSKDAGTRTIVPSTTEEGDKRWTGRVMINGSTTSILDGFTRQEIGFLDSVATDDDIGGPEDADTEDRDRLSTMRPKDGNTEEEGVVGGGSGGVGTGSTTDHEGETAQHRSSPEGEPRRRSHHRQQLATQQRCLAAEDEEGEGEEGERRHTIHVSGASSVIPNATKQTTATSMYGLSSLFGMLGKGNGGRSKAPTSKAAMTESIVSRPENEDIGSGTGRMSDGNTDRDETIRASRSRTRGRLQMLQENDRHRREQREKRNGSSRRQTGSRRLDEDHHDLELESIHGSIIFPEQHHDGGGDMNGHPDWTSDDRQDRLGPRDRTTDAAFPRPSLETGEEDLHGEGSETHASATERDPQAFPYDAEEDDETYSRHPGLRHRKRPSSQSRHHQDQYQREGSASRRSIDRDSRSGHLRDGSYDDYGVIGDEDPETRLADHPRFTGSSLYAYSFRNLLWAAFCCFILGTLLRVYVIVPSFVNTVSLSPKHRQTTYYYYYYPGPATVGRRGYQPLQGQTLTVPASASSSSSSATEQQHHGGEDRAGWISKSAKYLRHGDDEDDEEDSWPQGIKELFSVRGVLGYNFVLLAFPDERPPQHSSSSS